MVNEQNKSKKENNLSPLTPYFSEETNSTPTPTNLTFPSPTLPDFEEWGESLNNFLGLKSKYQTLLKNLEIREREVKRLEAEKSQWTQEKAELEQYQTKQAARLTSYTQQITHLKLELKESGNDFLQINEKNQDQQATIQHLIQLFQQERLNNQQLSQRLEQEIDENHRLKENQEQTNANLLIKVEELTNLKNFTEQEREEWKNIIAQQSEQHQQETQERERRHSEQIDNLRKFQSQEPVKPVPKRLALHHKSHSYSSPSSNRSSYTVEDEIIFTSPLSAELKDQGFKESSGIISSDNKEKKYRHRSAPVVVKDDNIIEALDQIFTTIENKETEEGISQAINQQTLADEREEMLNEINQLKVNQTNLERAYKTLFDEKVEQERLLKSFNEKELKWEKDRQEYEKLLFNYTQKEQDLQNKNQRLTEELNETKYQLLETKVKKNRAEQVIKETESELRLKQREVNELNNNLVEISKELEEKKEVTLDQLEAKESELSALIEQAEIILKIK